MSRKTNLFYVNTQDSNFLTFSNFTEALTGNFLSTDWKVYPSRFLCLYVPELLDDDNKLDKEKQEAFIKNYLVSYYENKLAFLRDYYTKSLNEGRTIATDSSTADTSIKDVETFDIEGDINAFAWLMKTIHDFDENNQITFLGEVTEFDYKGTYTDTICIIDSSEGYSESGKILSYKVDVKSNTPIVYGYDEPTLYGWKPEELNGSDYADAEIKFDNDESYEIYSEWDLTKQEEDKTSIKFNVIIPLFDITNIYYTNFNSTDENVTLEENLELKNYRYDESTGELRKQTIDYSDREKRSINNPLGIWFADELIELRRDIESKYAPSWSLTISSQFKPFPYSNKYDNNDITSKDNQQAFYTYAKILAQQNNVSDKLSRISSRLSIIEQSLLNLETLDNKQLIEKISSLEMLSDNLSNILNNLDKIIDTKIAAAINELSYKWK